jgi:hypothetical protein
MKFFILNNFLYESDPQIRMLLHHLQSHTENITNISRARAEEVTLRYCGWQSFIPDNLELSSKCNTIFAAPKEVLCPSPIQCVSHDSLLPSTQNSL